MSYFWSTFIQPLCEEENPQPQPQPRPRKQEVLPKQEERDANASIPTAEAFVPKYVTRRPKHIVVPPTPPPPPSTPQEFVEDGECTPTRVCNSTTHQLESLFESTTDLYDDDECCTPTRETGETESKFVFDFNNLELNKYNIQAECTPQHSVYNSPRISVDKLDMFNWEPKYTTVNHGIFKNSMVNGGRVQPRSLPSSPVVKRQRISSVSLNDVQYNLQSGIQELARLQKQFENLSIQLLDLQTNLY
jgi:hypothetical protein